MEKVIIQQKKTQTISTLKQYSKAFFFIQNLQKTIITVY